MYKRELSRALDEARRAVDGYFIAWDKQNVLTMNLFREYNSNPSPEKYDAYFQNYLKETEAYKTWRDTEVYLEDLLTEKKTRESQKEYTHD